MSDQVVRIYSTRNEPEAHLVRRQLAIAGIEALVTGERAGVALGLDTLIEDTLPAVWVDARDAERAAQVVQDWLQLGRSANDAPIPAWRCPQCSEAVEGQFAACWNCGEVKPDDPAAVEAPEPMDATASEQPHPLHTGRVIKIFTARDLLEAHHVRGMIESAGIRAAVMGETLSFARGEVPMTQETLPSVWVLECDAEAAMPIVREWVGPGDREPEDVMLAAWRCPQCGEAIEGQFSACWNCGMSRPMENLA